MIIEDGTSYYAESFCQFFSHYIPRYDHREVDLKALNYLFILSWAVETQFSSFFLSYSERWLSLAFNTIDRVLSTI